MGVRRVTARTGRERLGTRDIATREVVALLAGNGGMPATQRIAGAVVIEGCAIDRLERGSLVAPAAGGPQLALVNVGVTGNALAMLERLVTRNGMSTGVADELQARRLMTGGTTDGVVSAREWIVCLGVVETGRRLPMLDVVALDAILSERAAMRVFVTRCAAAFEAEPPGIRLGPLHEPHDG